MGDKEGENGVTGIGEERNLAGPRTAVKCCIAHEGARGPKDRAAARWGPLHSTPAA